MKPQLKTLEYYDSVDLNEYLRKEYKIDTHKFLGWIMDGSSGGNGSIHTLYLDEFLEDYDKEDEWAAQIYRILKNDFNPKDGVMTIYVWW